MSVTQKEIAEKLNISQAHVARALGKGSSKVSAKTKARIEAVALEMGYDRESNREARTMIGRRYARRPRTNIVAVAMPIPEGIAPQRIPFYNAFLEGVEAEVAAVGDCDVCIIHKRNEQIPRLLRGSELDGAIIAGFTPEQIPVIRSSGLALVTYQSSYPGVPSIRANDHEGTYKATHYLLDLGHRHIAYIGVVPDDENNEVVALRFQGYRDALAEARAPIHDEWVEMSLTMPSSLGNDYCIGCNCCAACMGWSSLKTKGKQATGLPPFTAVVCHNDVIGMGVIRQAEKDGLVLPRDLSVTGFDGLSDYYDFHPRLTSVGCSHYEMGRSAVRALQKAIDEMMDAPPDADKEAPKSCAAVEPQIFSVHISIGESTAAPCSAC